MHGGYTRCGKGNMRTRDDVINEAIYLLSKKTGEDFYGYRSEIWIICGNIYDEASRDSCMLSAVPSDDEIEKYLKFNYSTDPSEAGIYLGTNIIATGAIRKFIRWIRKKK